MMIIEMGKRQFITLKFQGSSLILYGCIYLAVFNAFSLGLLLS